MRKIVKIVTFYDDGTFTESTPSPYMPTTPMTPYKGEFPWTPDNTPKWNEVSKCSKCGIELKGAMGYVCTNYPCPCGLGGAWCSVTDGVSK